MQLRRRQFLHLAAGAASLQTFPNLAGAQTYPSRPVRIIVGFTSGSAFDILARLIGQGLSERLGQPFVIENRGGAGGTLATEAVVRARADGYTLLMTGSTDAINSTLYDKLNYTYVRDIAPVAAVSRAPNMIVVHPSFPERTVPELIAYAKANPGKVSFASAGIGSTAHMSGELFQAMAGINLLHVPYRGLAPAITDLMGGQVQVIFSTMPPAIELVRAGKLQALAVTSAERSQALPDLPTVGNFLPGYDAALLAGLGAPRDTPHEVVQRLNQTVNAILANPEMKARLAELGNVATPMTVAGFSKTLAEETEKWAKVIRTTNIKPE